MDLVRTYRVNEYNADMFSLNDLHITYTKNILCISRCGKLCKYLTLKYKWVAFRGRSLKSCSVNEELEIRVKYTILLMLICFVKMLNILC